MTEYEVHALIWQKSMFYGQITAAIATFLAVLVSLGIITFKKVDMFLIYSPDVSVDKNGFASIIISNSGNKVIILKKILITIENTSVGEAVFINDEYWLGSAVVKVIHPSETIKITLSYNELRRHYGHYISLTKKNENKLIKLKLIDTTGKEYIKITNMSFKQYMNLTFELQKNIALAHGKDSEYG